jgi:hypothetical protein
MRGSAKWRSWKGAWVFAFIFLGAPLILAADLSAPLKCRYEGQYFKVTDGQTEWQKYIGNWDNKEVKIRCGTQVAAALIGSYFVFFSDGVIQEHFIGSFEEGRRTLRLAGDQAAAVMGAYFVHMKRDGALVSRYVSTPDAYPVLDLSSKIAIAAYGKTLVVSDGKTVDIRYVGSSASIRVLARGSIAAAMMGPYFVGAQIRDGASGSLVLWSELFVGNREAQDTWIGNSDLVAASFSGYFLVYDGARAAIATRYVGQVGRVSLEGDQALFETPSGDLFVYQVKTGVFR